MKKQYDCIKLHFSSPLHLSRGREQFDESAKLLHSDTIAAALFVAAMKIGASEQDALDMLDACRLSSAFPFADQEFFFPKPIMRLPFSFADTAEEKQAKPIKKLQYLGKSWFEKAINNETDVIRADDHLKAGVSFVSEVHSSLVYKSGVTQRVRIAPDNSDKSDPYYTERLFFNEGAGLFILSEWLENRHKDLFYASFRMLGDLGIGTDRAVGNGFFEPEIATIELRIPDVPTHQCALGLYLPAENELTANDFDKSSWSLIKRGGYLAGASNEEHITLRKRSIYMFETGSVFPAKPLIGKRENLRPEWNGLTHSVWREGRPVFIPVMNPPTT